MYYYGVTNKKQLIEMVDEVCAVYGNGKNNTADLLIKGIMAVETNMATYIDPTPEGAGNGVCQFDRAPFEDIQRRVVMYKSKWVFLAKKNFGIDLKNVTHHMLNYAPLPSIIYCRLFLKLIPEEIPSDVEGMAKYWKKYYNTVLGKGKVEDFIKKYNKYVGGK